MPPLRSARLLDQVRERIRYLHYSIRTEEAYVHWIRAFVFFHDRRHPREMGGPEVEAFLSWLANERNVAVSTHRQVVGAVIPVSEGAEPEFAVDGGYRPAPARAAFAGGVVGRSGDAHSGAAAG